MSAQITIPSLRGNMSLEEKPAVYKYNPSNGAGSGVSNGSSGLGFFEDVAPTDVCKTMKMTAIKKSWNILESGIGFGWVTLTSLWLGLRFIVILDWAHNNELFIVSRTSQLSIMRQSIFQEVLLHIAGGDHYKLEISKRMSLWDEGRISSASDWLRY